MKKTIILIIILFIISLLRLYSSPQLNWCTYIGRPGDYDYSEEIHDFQTDTSGNLYLTGLTLSSNFPVTTGAFDETYNGGQCDAFISKLKPDGTNYIFSTFLGSINVDCGESIAIDNYGNSYICGRTSIGGIYNYNNFPITSGSYDTILTVVFGTAGFVLKLNSYGSALIYSTYLSGPIKNASYRTDCPSHCITIDSLSNSYIAGYTKSQNFPTTIGAYNRKFKDFTDIYITKINISGSALIYSTFIGGNSVDDVTKISIDKSCNIYITGYTKSVEYPITENVIKTSFSGSKDAFATKLNSAGSALIYSTYIGGNQIDSASNMVIDNNNDIYITGYTYSQNYQISPGAYDTLLNKGNNIISDDIFVTKLNSTCTAILFSTFIGGKKLDESYSITLDENNNVYLTGITSSIDFPTSIDGNDNIYRGIFFAYDYLDGFITELNSAGSGLIYSSYFKGNGLNIVYHGKLNSIYMSGWSNASDLPVTSGVFNGIFSNGPWGNAFVSKFNICKDIPIIQTLNDNLNISLDCGKYIVDSLFINNLGLCNPLRIDSIIIIGDTSFSVDKLLYPFFVLSNDSISVIIKYAPKVNVDKTALLKIYNNSSNSPQKIINLQGKVNKVPEIQITKLDSLIDFKCPVFFNDTIILHNTGTCTLTLSSYSISGVNSTYYTLLKPDNFPLNINPNDSTKIIIHFNTDYTNNIKSAYLSLLNNSLISPYIIKLISRFDTLASEINNSESDTIIINLGNICPGSDKDTTITLFNKSSIGTTFKIENKDPQLQIVPIGKAEKEGFDNPLNIQRKK
jgi:hypothetical protein